MKILFCLGSMTRGGAERVVAALSNSFVKKNDVCIVVTPPDAPMYDLDSKIRFLTLDNTKKKHGFLRRTYGRIRRLRKILKDEKPDIIVSMLPEPTFRLMVAKSFLSIKTIISVRNDPNVEYNNMFKRILVQLLYTKADGFVFQTPDAKKWFSKKIQSKSVVIPNPIDETFLRKPYSGEREKRIVTVGRLVEQKNQKLLIDAFDEFYKKHKDYKLEIYGDGPLKVRLQSYINGLGLADVVELMGEVSDIGNKIYKAKMFVLTSDYEGMPNALMEAMALGLPCVSTDCSIGGPRYLIKDSKGGLLVKVGDAAMIVRAMSKLSNDNIFADDISNKASSVCKEFNVASIIDLWNKYIFVIIGRDSVK